MPSPLSRRLANRRAEATQKLVVFSIHQTGFALPIQAIEKVIPLNQLYGALDGQGLRFTHYQDRQILVVDAQERIFGIQQREVRLISPQASSLQASSLQASSLQASSLQASSLQAADDSPSSQIFLPDNLNFRVNSPAYLLIVQDNARDFIGIPLYSQPSLRRVPLSDLKPLPSAYLTDGNIRCVSALVVIQGEPPLFLLNLDQLLKVELRSLPSTSNLMN